MLFKFVGEENFTHTKSSYSETRKHLVNAFRGIICGKLKPSVVICDDFHSDLFPYPETLATHRLDEVNIGYLIRIFYTQCTFIDTKIN